MRTSLLLFLALSACSDYDLNSNKGDPSDPEDTGDTGPEVDTGDTTPPGECGTASAPAIDVALNDACDIGVQTGTFTPVVEWELSGKNGYGPPSIGQLTDDNGDGAIDQRDTPDIVFITNDGSGLYCVDGATGRENWHSRVITDSLSISAIGDLDGDGRNEVVASNGTTQVVAFDNTGALLWKATVDSRVGSAQLYSSLTPAIADLDNDGHAEVIAGHAILSYDGRVLGTGAYGVGSCPNQSSPTLLEGSIPVPVDVDGDGIQEVVVGNAIYNMDGSAMATNGLSDGTVAVADFDLDGEPEFVVNSGNTVRTLETDLRPTGWVGTFNSTNYVGPLAVDDLDGDGVPDFVAAGSGSLRAYRWDGTMIWSQRVQDTSGASGPILYDFEMDGYPEVVYADEEYVHVFNGLDGSIKLESGDHQSATLFEIPLVADVDNDGEVEIIMQHGQGAHGLTVFGDADHTWPAGRQVWNQHAYSITNVNDDGSIPGDPTPNWELYNNFRSGDAGLPPSSWNDVTPEVVDVCTEECPDRLIITVRVWNGGTEEVAAGLGVVVRAGVDGPVVTVSSTPAAIASGRSSEGIELVVRAADLGGEAPYVDVDRDALLNSTLTECVEDNNQTFVEGGSCP